MMDLIRGAPHSDEYIEQKTEGADLPFCKWSLPATTTLDLECLHVILAALVRKVLESCHKGRAYIHVHVHEWYILTG